MDKLHYIHMVEHYSTVKISEEGIHTGSEKTTYLHPEKFERNPPFDVRETCWKATNRDGSETCWRLSVTGSAAYHRLERCSGAKMLTAGSHAVRAMRKSTGTRKKSPFVLQGPF